ncbi:hypothetical protein CXB51_005729 [Gossypium anomalum]|uniref:Uncharacterized protein n=1 Tax=Gossypium anomalum TaxID=47600 RepID=A0A8J5ZCP3_9ROSI|nr:hypothetical protein CXB51_005729 [Gossypium anomalum]
MESFNISLLTKQVCRILTNLSCFMSHVLKVNYFPTLEFLQAGLGALDGGWAVDDPFRFGMIASFQVVATVELRTHPLVCRLVGRILSIPFSRLASYDMLVWKGDHTGCYTVRSDMSTLDMTAGVLVGSLAEKTSMLCTRDATVLHALMWLCVTTMTRCWVHAYNFITMSSLLSLQKH